MSTKHRSPLRWRHTVVARRLPLPGSVTARIGDRVQPGDILAAVNLSPAKDWLIPVARQLQVSPKELHRHLLVQQGDQVQAGQLLAVRGQQSSHAPASGIVGHLDEHTGQLRLRESLADRPLPALVNAVEQLEVPRRRWGKLLHRQVGDTVRRGEVLAGEYPGHLLFSPVSGQILEVDLRAGQIVITPLDPPFELRAAVPGQVALVTANGCDIHCCAAKVAGHLRLGRTAYGPLMAIAPPPGGVVDDEQITSEMAGKVLVLSSPLSGAAFLRARVLGVAALVAGSAHLADLMSVAGLRRPADALCADLPDIAVLLTEGCGSQPMQPALFEQLQLHTGQHAYISPDRPELLIIE